MDEFSRVCALLTKTSAAIQPSKMIVNTPHSVRMEFTCGPKSDERILTALTMFKTTWAIRVGPSVKIAMTAINGPNIGIKSPVTPNHPTLNKISEAMAKFLMVFKT